jgi:translation initiation factor IF-3
MKNSNFDKKFYGKEFNRNDDDHRVNWQIRVPQVRVIKEEEQLGIMSTDAARKLAQDEGLDLVEISPSARPPVCKIMNYGRFKYEQNLKKKENAKKQRESQIQLKEIRLRPGIGENDINTKINQAKKFLEENCRIQFNLQFRGQRELALKEQGFSVMNKIVEILSPFGLIEQSPRIEKNRMICLIAPKS